MKEHEFGTEGRYQLLLLPASDTKGSPLRTGGVMAE
jgi:hypothetical protein